MLYICIMQGSDYYKYPSRWDLYRRRNDDEEIEGPTKEEYDAMDTLVDKVARGDVGGRPLRSRWIEPYAEYKEFPWEYEEYNPEKDIIF